jgi:hypothetical protein
LNNIRPFSELPDYASGDLHGTSIATAAKAQVTIEQVPGSEADPLREQVRLALELQDDPENRMRFDSLFSHILASLFTEHRTLLGPLKKEIASQAIQCVDEALAFYGRMKAERPLSSEEKQQGRVYIDLMESAQRLLKL